MMLLMVSVVALLLATSSMRAESLSISSSMPPSCVSSDWNLAMCSKLASCSSLMSLFKVSSWVSCVWISAMASPLFSAISLTLLNSVKRSASVWLMPAIASWSLLISEASALSLRAAFRSSCALAKFSCSVPISSCRAVSFWFSVPSRPFTSSIRSLMRSESAITSEASALPLASVVSSATSCCNSLTVLLSALPAIAVSICPCRVSMALLIAAVMSAVEMCGSSFTWSICSCNERMSSS